METVKIEKKTLFTFYLDTDSGGQVEFIRPNIQSNIAQKKSLMQKL